MSTLRRHRWAVNVVGLLSALAAAALFSPGEARADCGDYVVIGKPQHAAAAHRQMDHPQLPTSGTPANRPAPCTGPRCSGGPPVTPLQPAPPTNVRGDDYGLPVFLIAAADDFSSTYRYDTLLSVPTGPRPTVYHPPR